MLKQVSILNPRSNKDDYTDKIVESLKRDMRKKVNAFQHPPILLLSFDLQIEGMLVHVFSQSVLKRV